MALRLLEVIVPDQYFNEVSAVIRNHEVSDYWQTCGCESNIIFKIILPVEQTESLMDQLEKEYKHLDAFRLILLPLDASFPTPREIERKAQESQETKNGDNAPLRVSWQELYSEIFDRSKLTHVFLVMVFLSTVVAALGLLRGNVAVIIGAMVIAPLLGSNVALAMAVTLGDTELGRNAIRTNAWGIALAFTVSLFIGHFTEVNPQQPEIMARTVVSHADIVLALSSGVAGALAYTSGASATLIGVMVAVALIPPLVTSGMLLGSGYYAWALDAFLLFAINLISINLAGVVTFLVQGIRPINWWEEERANKATRMAVLVWALLLAALILLLFFRFRIIGGTAL